MKRQIRAKLARARNREDLGVDLPAAVKPDVVEVIRDYQRRRREADGVAGGEPERMYEASEIAKELRCSVDVIRREFQKLEGVIVFGGERKKIRIPDSVYRAWLASRTVGGRKQ